MNVELIKAIQWKYSIWLFGNFPENQSKGERRKALYSWLFSIHLRCCLHHKISVIFWFSRSIAMKHEKSHLNTRKLVWWFISKNLEFSFWVRFFQVPESATISFAERPWLLKLEMRFWRLKEGPGMLLFAPEKLAVVESLLPSFTSQLGPPSCVLHRVN